MSRDIFISHAVKDKLLADALVDLLQLGTNVNSDNVFCSSLEGLGIPSGANFVDHIKQEIQTPKIVIALISPNYLGSQFCLCELGATWAMSHQMFPLLVPPLSYADVQGVMTGVQLTRVDYKDGLNQFRDQLLAALGIKGSPTARWEKKRDQFLNDLTAILAALPKPQVVSAAEHDKVKRDYDDAKVEIDGLETQLNAQKALIAQLSTAKDKTEVARIKAAHSSSAETLLKLERAMELALKDVPKAVSFVSFKEMANGQEVVLDYNRAKEFAEEITSAADERLVNIDDRGGCTVNRRHPKIRPIEEACEALSKFLAGDIEDLAEDFEVQHQTPLELNNRKYWELQLDRRIQRVYA